MTTKKSPFKNLKSVFGKKKGKQVGESSKILKDEGTESNPMKEDIEYETEKEGSGTESEEESEQDSEHDNTMVDIAYITMGEYKRRMRVDIRPGLVQPAIPTTKNFELKGHILA